jgi:ubiquitin C-terminal hydrolase
VECSKAQSQCDRWTRLQNSWELMGAAASGPSKFERDLQELKNDKRNLSLEGQHFFGFENFGNTCYCNSVLQALYYCVPFRDHLLARSKSPGDAPSDGKNARFSNSFPTNTILYQLAELFHEISNKKQVHGYHAPTPFLQVLRERNEIFRGNMQQVRHFLSPIWSCDEMATPQPYYVNKKAQTMYLLSQ